MPLLMCPNCHASMSEVKRNDVAFDMCPTCRGVWLDRGELEKIIAGAKDERAAFEQDRTQFYQDPDAYRRSHPQPPPQQYQQQQRPQQGYFRLLREPGVYQPGFWASSFLPLFASTKATIPSVNPITP